MDVNSIARSASELSDDVTSEARARNLTAANEKMDNLLESPVECDGSFCNFAINAVVGYMEEVRQVE